MYESNTNNTGQSMGNRLLLFMVIFLGVMMAQRLFFPPTPPVEQAVEEQSDEEKEPKGDDEAKSDDTSDGGAAATGLDVAAQREEVSEEWITLGSVDPDPEKNPYRMLVTLTNRGAALLRTEMSADTYRDTEDRTGYLGQIVVDEAVRGDGCPVQVVGHGTPAEKAGLKRGDLITKFDTVPVTGFDSLRQALLATTPGQRVKITYQRDGESAETEVELTHKPLEVIRPEHMVDNYQQFVELQGLHGYDVERDDPLSLLATLQTYDGDSLGKTAQVEGGEKSAKEKLPRDASLDAELRNVALRTDCWSIDRERTGGDRAVFFYDLPNLGLRMTKIYELARDGSEADPYGGYHLTFTIEIENIDPDSSHKVAYQLDGPNGLPLEGAWYSRKVGPGWSSYGVRDVLVQYGGRSPNLVPCRKIALRDEDVEVWRNDSLDFLGVDAQYFSAVLIPDKKSDEIWLDSATPVRVGAYSPNWPTVTNTSFRMVSREFELAKAGSEGSRISHTYSLFAGPKKPEVLAPYGLGDTIFYGWFWFVAQPLQMFLHALKAVVWNYGLAIILLTIIVRSLMHPISRKQMLNAMKMKELQPEIKRIQEQYKNNPEERMRAQNELFRKHNFNPFHGCGVMFLQLPIFIGLYRALQVDVELREASLIGVGVRWCSNLAAPDMLFDWSGFWQGIGWDSFNMGQGILYLGPFFNILPMVTIVLFMVQQKYMMPPAEDDQQKAMRNMMQFMMIFMGLLFFKVASGLCIYFIASSIFGVVERQFLPKAKETPASSEPPKREVQTAKRRPTQKKKGKKKK